MRKNEIETKRKAGTKQKAERMRREYWKPGACYTFKGAGRVWFSFLDAKKRSDGRRVIRFETETDALQWLFAAGIN